MNLLWIGLLAGGLAAIGAAVEENPVLVELVQQGVPMAGGEMVRLPPPTIPDGLDEAAQWAAITRIAQPRYSVEDFVRNSVVAEFALDRRTISANNPKLPVNGVDFWFVAYGDWNTINSETFLEGVLKSSTKGNKEGRLTKSGRLSEAEIARRNLRLRNTPGQEERFFYTTFAMFDRVELSSTRYSVLSRSPESLLLAAKIDPRFNGDPEYPNQWLPVNVDNTGQEHYGPPQPYVGAAFYVKVTKLIKPAGALWIEYHLVYDEPYGWFEGAPLLRSKLPLIIQEQVRAFRRKLASASGGK